MIAGCPKCGARYRIEREKLERENVRLRCSRCEAVFRVRAPEPAPAAEPAVEKPPAPIQVPAPTPAPEPQAAGTPASGPIVLVALSDDEVCKRTAEVLKLRGLRVAMARDGVEAMLAIQRELPQAVVLGADLSKMFGFQVCEVVKRNESLRHIHVVLVGAIHHPDRYRRAPEELYGADAYLDAPDLPDGLFPILERGGLPIAPLSPAAAEAQPAPPEAPQAPTAPAPAPARPPAQTELPAADAAASPAPTPPAADPLAEERAAAERLARIIVSDIVLYNEEKFSEAVRNGNVEEVMEADLAEGRGLFEQRIDARLRAQGDLLMQELLRVAQSRGNR